MMFSSITSKRANNDELSLYFCDMSIFRKLVQLLISKILLNKIDHIDINLKRFQLDFA